MFHLTREAHITCEAIITHKVLITFRLRNTSFSWQGQKDLVSSLRRKVEEYFDFATLLGMAQPQKLALLIFGNPARAALTTHRVVIHYRSPSSPSVSNPSKTKKDTLFCVSFFILAGAEGLEPTTHGFGDQYSTN